MHKYTWTSFDIDEHAFKVMEVCSFLHGEQIT